MLFSLAAIWGASFFFAEVALRELGPLTIAAHRVFWALPVLGAVIWFRQLAIPRQAGIWVSFLVMGALNNAIPFVLIFWGQTRIESGLASILNGSTAIWGAVVAGLLLKDEPLTRNKLLGAAFGLAGVAVIMGPEALSAFNPANMAQMAIILAALSYALAGVWARLRLKGVPAEWNAMGMLTGSTILLIPLACIIEGTPDLSLHFVTWGSLAGLSVLCTAIAYLLYFAILPRAGAANLMLVTLLIPPFSIFLGAVFLDERLGATAIAGFGLIALGLLITDGRALGVFRR